MNLSYNIENIPQNLDSKDCVFFWNPKDVDTVGRHVLTQWQKTPFQVDKERYETAEKYMMMEKAKLFGDDEVFEALRKTRHPRECKALGRKIQNFDEELWNQHKIQVVYNGNWAKFTQHKDLQQYLLRSKEKILIEASPYDKIWGIGLAKDDARALVPSQWQGENLLGFVLMEVRKNLV